MHLQELENEELATTKSRITCTAQNEKEKKNKKSSSMLKAGKADCMKQQQQKQPSLQSMLFWPNREIWKLERQAMKGNNFFVKHIL